MSLLRYLRMSLSDAARPTVDVAQALTVGDAAFTAGHFDQALTRLLMKSADKGASTVQVLLMPARFVSAWEHGTPMASRAIAAPLVIPATLNDGGYLSPHSDPDQRPWIPRDHLDGADGRWPSVGPLEAFDRFREVRTAAPTHWAEVLAYADDMLKAVAGASIRGLALERHVRVPGVAVLAKGPPLPARHLLDLVKGLDAAGALACLAAADSPGPRRPVVIAGPELNLLQRRHLGQMGARFPLDPRQREALLHAAALPEGEILAVNGPPGTGKTTLIRSLVADTVVRAALGAARGAPRAAPVIFIASTNNQAVENAIRSLDAADLPPDLDGAPLARRWVPEAASFALWLPARGRDRGQFQYGAFDGAPDGLPARMHAPQVVANAWPNLLGHAEAHFGRGFVTPAAVATALLEELSQLCAEIEAVTEASGVVAAGRAAKVAPDAARSAAERRLEQARLGRTGSEARRRAVEDAALELDPPFPRSLFAWLSGGRRARWVRVRRRLRAAGISHPIIERLETPDRKAFLQALHTAVADADTAAAAEFEEALKAAECARRTADLVAMWPTRIDDLTRRFAAPPGLAEAAREDPDAVQPLLDMTLRVRAFLLAARFWEVEWLVRTRADQKPGKPLGFLNQPHRPGAERKFRHMACVTPVFVSTLHMLPKHLSIWNPDAARPGTQTHLTDFVDLLIIDEAGQIAPEIGVPALALARRVVAIGDIHQIEPVWGVSAPTDEANMARCGLVSDDLRRLRDTGLDAASGSLMAVARAATAFTREDEEGLFLNEHRRCPNEIVEFCNRLVYGDRLIFRTPPPEKPPPLPALGWAHVRGEAKRAGSSWVNEQEAAEILSWLARRRQQIEVHFGRPIEEVVAIVTPYAPQRTAVRALLAGCKLPQEITVGTVHALQGAECEIVLFSSTVVRDRAGTRPFFDQKPNMLNVAASRAKSAFLVFGDMSLFDPTSGAPSGVLARACLADPDAEITDVEARPELGSGGEGGSAIRITTLEDHRRTLREALQSACHRVLIISPWIRAAAVAADDVVALVRGSVARGVDVAIAYDESRIMPGDQSAWQAITALEQAGARLIATRHHSKTIAVDDAWITEGSFNWLSAVRDLQSPYRRLESSIRLKGGRAARYCAEAWSAVK